MVSCGRCLHDVCNARVRERRILYQESRKKERKKKQIKSQLSFQIHKYMVGWNVTLQRATAATLAAMGSNIEVKGICACAYIYMPNGWLCSKRNVVAIVRADTIDYNVPVLCMCMCVCNGINAREMKQMKEKKSRGVVEINHKSQLQEIVAVADIVKNFKDLQFTMKTTADAARTHQSLPLENRRHGEKAGGHKCYAFIYCLFVDATSDAHDGACYDCVRIVWLCQMSPK